MNKLDALYEINAEIEICLYQLDHEELGKLDGAASVVIKNVELSLQRIKDNILDEQY